VTLKKSHTIKLSEAEVAYASSPAMYYRSQMDEVQVCRAGKDTARFGGCDDLEVLSQHWGPREAVRHAPMLTWEQASYRTKGSGNMKNTLICDSVMITFVARFRF